MTDRELEQLFIDMESDRVERKASASDGAKIRQAVCAFANDMPDHRLPGVVFIGVNDDGSCASLRVTDELLCELAGMRSDGNILPLPNMSVQKRVIRGCELAAVVVAPSDFPPVRFKGQVWIRVGPRRAIASADEERRLSEKRLSKDLPFDLSPVRSATAHDLDLDLFQRTYLPAAVAPEVLERNQRSPQQQMASVRFVSAAEPPVPTVVGLLAVGKTPADYVPGAYVQFLRIEGKLLTDPIADRKECHGPLVDLLRQLDELLRANIHVSTDVKSGPVESRKPDYPLAALQQLFRNAVMHRNYQTSNAPVRITWFSDRIEIQNPGGPFGQVTRQNFGRPGITDYRNPNVAEVMKTLGYVQRFGVGIQIAVKALEDNGNPRPDFDVQDEHVLVVVRRRP